MRQNRTPRTRPADRLFYDITARRLHSAHRAGLDSAGWSRHMLTLRDLAARYPATGRYQGDQITYGRYRGYDAARRIARMG